MPAPYDMLDRRRIVMGAWARHVTGEGAQVVRLGRDTA